MLTWLLSSASLAATVANAHKRRWCWPVWIGTNAGWCAFDCAAGNWPRACLMAVYAGLAVYGWRKWRTDGVR